MRGNTPAAFWLCVFIFVSTGTVYGSPGNSSDIDKRNTLKFPDKSTITFYHMRSPMPWRMPKEGEKPRPAFFIGNVEIKAGKYTILADSVVLWVGGYVVRKPGGLSNESGIAEMYAEGNVYMTDGGDFVSAEKVYYDFSKHEGLIKNAMLKTSRANIRKFRTGKLFEEIEEALAKDPRAFVPMFVRAKELRAKALNSYKVKDGSLSTCSFLEPHWGLESDEAEITPLGHLNAKGNIFWIWGVPIPLPPVRIEREFRPPIKRLRWYYTTSWGHTLATEWSVFSRKLVDVDLRYDSFAKRGKGLGANFIFGSKRLSKDLFYTTARGYYLEDKGEEELEGVPVEEPFRHRLKLTHRQVLADDFRMEAVYSSISDENFLRYFFAREYRAFTEQGSYLFLKKTSGSRAVSALFQREVNDFYSRSEYAPEVRAYAFGEGLGLGIFLDTEAGAGYVGKNFSTDSVEDDYYYGRYDWSAEIKRPVSWGGFFTVTPFARMRVTGWGERVNSTDSEDDLDRFTSWVGTSLSTQLGRVYGCTSDFLKINKLRHIIRPEIEWRKRVYNNLGSDELLYVDETEDVPLNNEIRLKLANIFQTKRKNPKTGKFQPKEIAKFEIETLLDLNRGEDNSDELLAGSRADFEVLFSPYLSVGLDAEYDHAGKEFSSAGIGIVTNPVAGFSLFVGGRYEPGAKRTMITELDVSPTKKWGFRAMWETDLIKSEYRRKAVLMRRNFHQWVLEWGYTVDYTTGEPVREWTIYFSPSGLLRRKPGLFRNTGGDFTGEYLPRF